MADQLKPWASLDRQVEILQERGLTDADEFRHELSTIGYYRLSGYSYPLRELAPRGSERARLDTFIPEARMRHVVELYDFDEKLRLVVWDALRKLEICLRVDVGYVLGEHDPLIHEHIQKYWPSGAMRSRAEKFTQHLKTTISRSGEDFVKHYNRDYNGHLPVWVVTEVLEFGQLVTLLSLAPFEQRRQIADKYMVRGDELESWIRTANFVRNICAHHARLWNRQLVIRPLVKYRRTDSVFVPGLASSKMYAAFTLIAFLLRRGGFTSEINAISQVLQDFPTSIPAVSITHMGAPSHWSNQPIWLNS